MTFPSRSTFGSMGVNNEGQGQMLSQPRHSCPPRSICCDLGHESPKLSQLELLLTRIGGRTKRERERRWVPCRSFKGLTQRDRAQAKE